MALIETVYAPQWGRLSSSRITLQRRPDSGDDLPAAMGPALIEPDHRRPGGCTPATGTRRNGAGSHRAGSRGSTYVRSPPLGHCRNGAGSHRAGSHLAIRHPQRQLFAAMGPALIEPDHCRTGWRWRASAAGRNGAGSHRAGSPAPSPAGPASESCGRNGAGSHRAGSPESGRPLTARDISPQWGRLSSSRITSRGGWTRTRWICAAMGPALIEPDHAHRARRRRPSTAGRNGAGSHRAGSPIPTAQGDGGRGAAMGPALIEPDHRSLRCRPRRAAPCRNGAGSHRAGSRAEPPAGAVLRADAAMGPALIEPDHPCAPPRCHRARPCRNGAGSHRAGSRDGAMRQLAGAKWPQWGRLSSSRIT